MNDIFVGRAYVILEKSIIYRVYVAAWTFIPYAYLLKNYNSDSKCIFTALLLLTPCC